MRRWGTGWVAALRRGRGGVPSSAGSSGGFLAPSAVSLKQTFMARLGDVILTVLDFLSERLVRSELRIGAGLVCKDAGAVCVALPPNPA